MELFKARTTQIELKLDSEAKVETLWPVFQKLIEKMKPPIIVLEELFKVLFVGEKSLLLKLIDLAKILITFKIELKTQIFNKSSHKIFEIFSHYQDKNLRWVRVLHFSNEGTNELTQVYLV